MLDGHQYRRLDILDKIAFLTSCYRLVAGSIGLFTLQQKCRTKQNFLGGSIIVSDWLKKQCGGVYYLLIWYCSLTVDSKGHSSRVATRMLNYKQKYKSSLGGPRSCVTSTGKIAEKAVWCVIYSMVLHFECWFNKRSLLRGYFLGFLPAGNFVFFHVRIKKWR